MADRADILVLCGPTATGKTTLAVEMAGRLGGEVISADSMQIYDGLRIGTAQPTPEEMRGIPHHLVGFLPPERSFSVAEYVRAAAGCIEDIRARGRLPIVAGGTGLYISSLVNGISFTDERRDPNVRARLETELRERGAAPLYARLTEIDPAYAAKVHPNNHGRVLRALELYEQTGRTMSQQAAASRPAQRPYHTLIIGLNAPNRTCLYERIEARVDAMMQCGLLEEARRVYERRSEFKTAAQAIGYKEFFPYFEAARRGAAGEECRAVLAACVCALKQASRNYAKRQITWFKKLDGLQWMAVGDPAVPERIEALWKAHTLRDEKQGSVENSAWK